MTVEILVVAEGLVLVADDHAHEGALRDRPGVAFRDHAGAGRAELRLVAAEGALEEVRRLDAARPGRVVELGLERPGAHDGGGAEEVGVLEGQTCGAVAAHAEAVEQAPFPLGHGAIRGVDVRQQVADDHRLDRRGAVGPVDVHAHLKAVHEHDQAGGRLALADRAVEARRHGGDAGQPAAGAVQPVDDGEAPRGLGLIGRRTVEVVAHVALDRGAAEDVVRDPGRLHGPRHPSPAGCGGCGILVLGFFSRPAGSRHHHRQEQDGTAERHSVEQRPDTPIKPASAQGFTRRSAVPHAPHPR